MSYETETLDRLYLEWSQFTSARNSREIDAKALLDALLIGPHRTRNPELRERIQNLRARLEP